VSLQRLIDLVSRVDDVVGAGITEHAPSDGADVDREADAIRRVGAALQSM
jgi:arginase